MNVPEAVKQEARELIKQYGDSFDYLGEYEGWDTYMFHFPEDVDTGFPFVYLHNSGNVWTETGHEALSIIRSFLKD